MNHLPHLLFTAALVAASTSVASASTYNLTASIDRYYSKSGIGHYGALINITPGLTGLDNWREVDVTLISPTGLRHEKRFPSSSSLVANYEDIAPSSVDDQLTGKWIIEEIHETRGTRLYEFTIPPLQNSPLFPPTPQILSPEDGAVVGPTFEVVTDRTDGFGARYTGRFNPRDARPNVETGIGSAVFSFADVPGFSGGTLELRASDQDFVSGLSVTPLTPGPNVTFDDHLVLNTLSPPITLTIVVPEPPAVALVATGLVMFAPLCRRRMSNASI